jgi:hypothetical protein
LAVEYESFDTTSKQNRKPQVFPCAQRNHTNVMAIGSDNGNDKSTNQILQFMCDTLLSTSKELSNLRKEMHENAKKSLTQKPEKPQYFASRNTHQAKPIECFKCHKQGHIQRNCPMNDKNPQLQANQPNGSSNVQTRSNGLNQQ